MPTIKAPYNFVPLQQQVVSPHWMEDISQDIPFEEGLSGDIKLKIVAKTDIFVRNGASRQEQETNNGLSFNDYRGEYFIPGTSIKGMVRNVLEILSYGRMAGRTDDVKYALRDLSGAMKNEYLVHFKPDKIYCGWLRKNDDNSYTLKDCGFPGRISHEKIDSAWGTRFKNDFSQENFKVNSNNKKAARYKYDKLQNRGSLRKKFSKVGVDIGREIYEADESGDRTGTLVCTGQPGPRKRGKDGKWTGHNLEFIFFEDKVVERAVDETVIDNFRFAYYEHDKPKWSVDWQTRRKELAAGKEIPVFFHKDKDGKVLSMGLSYLYKLPYAYSVGDAVRNHQGKDSRDLSDALFGYVQDQDARKGRVQIGHAFAVKNTAHKRQPAVQAVLSSPKASYYPAYIRQKFNNSSKPTGNYQSFMDRKAVIAGWKRYPVHANGVKIHVGEIDNDRIRSKFVPLQAGVEFECSVRYHNLLPVELGALLSALTFHGTEDTYHSIGMAKPLGYGKISLTIINPESELPVTEYLAAFEAYMNTRLSHTQPTWHTSEPVVELLAMATNHQNADFGYMTLNDHVTVKNQGEALNKYSVLVQAKPNPPSHCDRDAIAEMKDWHQKGEAARALKSDIASAVAAHKKKTKQDLAERWEAQKKAWLDALAKRLSDTEEQERKDRERREAEEREKEKDDRSVAARRDGPNYDSIKMNREVENNLKKVLEKWARDAYMVKDIQALLPDKPDGYIPKEFRGKLFEKLSEIIGKLSPGDRNKWRQQPLDTNGKYRLLAQWVGPEKASEFIQSINS